ncbi:MAG: TonB-dependent receptor [bacterium]|nr:TonB-dependent receptor [bacterium]
MEQGAGNASLSLARKDGMFSFYTMYKFNKQDAFLSGQVPSQNNDLYIYEGMQWHTGIQYKPSPAFQLTAGCMVSKFKNVIDFLGEPFGGEEYNYDIFMEALHFKDLRGGHSLLMGAKMEREGQYDGRLFLWDGSGFITDTDESAIFAPNESRNVYALMLEDNWRVSKTLRLVGGFRYDYFDGFRDATENVFNPRLGLVYRPSANLMLKALFATASRPPSIYERLGTALAPLRGSPDIKSENIRTFEVSAIWSSGGFQIQATPFFQVFNDKIEYIPGTGADADWFTACNNGKTEVLGIDLEARYYFNRSSYVYVVASKFKSDDKESNHETYFLPNFYMSAALNWNTGRFNINVNGYYRNRRLLPPNLLVNALYAGGSHFIANMSVTYKLDRKISLYLSADNISNRENSVPLSVDGMFVPMRRRTFHAGIKFFAKAD